ncbi:TcpE family conjugal transfer membrane protein [Staphylococcus caeli]|uniref:Transposon-related protein n=1 Tax=Staphylococcus caeli TaxID=2201815 RepID=A0A1D4Q094_9STAP|nr:TcpE family conjugal transfer membrane protein [Staphylococcus caeli]SCT28589.1 transposon-related protein [Staphylococcus caeli]SCT33541.1 transposon-related protein [Staphylococcus caeli]
MDKKAYNLKRTFEQPIVFYEITDNMRFNKGFRVDWIATFVVIELLLIFLYVKGFDVIVSSIQGMTILYFTVVPYFATKYLVKLKQDGKKLLFFLWDFIIYMLTIQMRKTHYAYDEEVYYNKQSKIKLE